MSKPWQPEIKNPAAHYMHEQYGITEERRVHLSLLMTKITHQDGTVITPVAQHVDKIAAICETPGEFAFCVFVHATYLATSPRIIMALG